MSLLQSRGAKVLMLSFGQGVNVLAMIFVAAYLSRVLSTAEYGTYRQSFLAFDLVGPLLVLGLPQALFVFIGRNPERARIYTLANMAMLFLSGTIFGLLMFFLGRNFLSELWCNPNLSISLAIMAFYGCVFYPTQTVTACLMGIGKAHLVMSYNLITRLFIVISVIGSVILFGSAAKNAVIGVMIATTLSLIFAIILVMLHTKKFIGHFTWSVFNEQLKFAVPVGIASILGTLSVSTDRLIVSLFGTTEQYAVYANGAMELPIIGIITGSITAVILPEMSSAFEKGEKRVAFELWAKFAVKAALILFPCCGAILILAETIMITVYSEDYAESAIPFKHYALALPAKIVMFGAIFQAVNKPQEILKTSIVGLVGNSVMVFLAARFLGAINSALGSIASLYLVFLPYSCSRIHAVLKIRTINIFPWKILFYIFLVCIIGLSSAYFLFRVNSLQNVILQIFVYSIVIIAGYALIPEIRKSIKLIFRE